MYTPHTITIFNVYTVNKQNCYQATKIEGVFKQGNRASAADGYGMKKTGKLKLFIPFTATAESGRAFIDPALFQELTDENRANYWTVSEKGDFFIVGEYTDTGETIRYDDIRKAYGSAHKVLVANCCDYGSDELRHWEVEGE